uniref:Uncharacterized protein n=1 Tax=candidate division WOR-3 bacterium TaxID=2052148 RepID=A0A7V0Z3K7_UNCW3
MEELEKFKKCLVEAIELAYEEEKKVIEGSAFIYETDVNGNYIPGTKVYWEKEFSGCGFARLQPSVETARLFRKILRKMDDCYRNYIGPHLISMKKNGRIWEIVIDDRTYSNGHIRRLQTFYSKIAEYLAKFGYKIDTKVRLD